MKVVHQILHARDALGKIDNSLLVVLSDYDSSAPACCCKARAGKTHFFVESFHDIVNRFTENGRKTNTHSSVCERVFMVTAVSGPRRVVGIDSGRSARVLKSKQGKLLSVTAPLKVDDGF